MVKVRTFIKHSASKGVVTYESDTADDIDLNTRELITEATGAQIVVPVPETLKSSESVAQIPDQQEKITLTTKTYDSFMFLTENFLSN